MEERGRKATEHIFMWIFSIVIGAISAYGLWVAIINYEKGNIIKALVISASSVIFWWVSTKIFGKKMIRSLVLHRFIEKHMKEKKKGGG